MVSVALTMVSYCFKRVFFRAKSDLYERRTF